MNKVELIGRTTTDIELKYTAQTQTAVAKFRLAVNRKKKDDPADFINCTAWGKTAELMDKYVQKGNRIGIVGRIQTGSYKDKDGKTVYTTDVIVEELEFLESKDSRQSEPQDEPQVDENGFMILDEVNLPF